jgi:hypothetical protein
MFGHEKKKLLSEGAEGRGVITSLYVGYLNPSTNPPRFEGVDESSVPPWTGETDLSVERYGYDVSVRVEFDDGPTTDLSTKLGYPMMRAEVGELREGDVLPVRYDPSNHKKVVFDMPALEANPHKTAEVSVDTASAGEIAATVQATGDTGQRASAAELLASGQRMTAVLREFSPSGKTVGDLDPALPDPNDPVYVIKVELPIEGSSPIEATFMTRVPEAKVASLRLGAHLNVAVNPANPSHEVAIDWANSPVAG